jgi:uncharacterized heparinase superfamily protein
MNTSKLRRQVAFARHIPPEKLAARVMLAAKRHVYQKLLWRTPAPALATHRLTRSANPPEAVFAPRSSVQKLSSGAFELTFLHHVRTFSIPFEWHRNELAVGTRLWKLNLHYHEFTESLTDEDFLHVVEDWIRHNEPFRESYWKDSWNSFALSIRVVVWMQQIAARRLPQESPLLESLILPSLVRQLRFLRSNLELDIGGNHLIKNVKALIWAGAFFSGHEADAWKQLGVSLLAHVLREQMLPDGMHNERSASYHAQVFADLLEIYNALGQDPIRSQLKDTLSAMAQTCVDLTHPDGGPVLFNDAGLAMAYSPEACLAAYQKLFDTSCPTALAAFSYPNAGYFGWRSQSVYLVADCGPIAPDDLPAHGHGDVLSFELSWEGRRVVVDQGVFEYNEGIRRMQARSASSHNTVCFVDADQADFFGAFRVGDRPRAQVLEFSANSESFHFSGTHDAFARLTGAPKHQRTFSADANKVRIEDRITGKPTRQARLAFLLHPAVRLSRLEEKWLLELPGVALVLTSTIALEVEAAVWWPDMGQELKTTRLVGVIEPGVVQVVTEVHSAANQQS